MSIQYARYKLEDIKDLIQELIRELEHIESELSTYKSRCNFLETENMLLKSQNSTKEKSNEIL